MNIILLDYESVCHNIWPKNKCRSLWPIFHGPLILPYTLKLFSGWTSYFGTVSQYDPTSDLIIFIGHSDLYFMVQWFCLISWRLFDVYTVIMCQCNVACALKQCRSQWSIFSWSSDLPYILTSIWWITTIEISSHSGATLDQKNIDPSNPFFHSPVILPYILNSIWWMNVKFLENESE